MALYIFLAFLYLRYNATHFCLATTCVSVLNSGIVAKIIGEVYPSICPPPAILMKFIERNVSTISSVVECLPPNPPLFRFAAPYLPQ